MSVYYIKQYLWYVLNFKSLIDNNKDFLENGQYKITNNYTTIELCSNKESRGFNTFNSKNKLTWIDEKIYKNLVFPLTLNSKKDKLFYGTVIIRTSSGKQIKIFDYNTMRMLTKYETKIMKEELIENRKYISQIINVPKVINNDFGSNYIIEEIINNKEIDKKKILKKIFKIYIKFYNENNCENKKITSEFLNRNIFFKKLYKNIKNKDIPFIRCHGDLWGSNILYSEKLYFIDFEHVNFYSFLYDIIFFIFNEAYINNDFSLLDGFFDGEYDYYFERFGEKINYNIEIQDKKEILLRFIYEFSDNRFYNLNKRTFKEQVKKIVQILDRYNIRLEK